MKTILHSIKCLFFAAAAMMLLPPTARAVDYHVSTPQTLQNALTLAAASSVSNNIYVTNGYYTGNFNYNSTTGNYLTLLADLPIHQRRVHFPKWYNLGQQHF